MAARLGVQDVVYCSWERGDSLPSLEARPAIHRELGASASPAPGHSLGERLKAWRTTRGLAQAAVAKLAGMDPKTLGAIERGRRVCARTHEAVRRVLDAPAHVSREDGT